jgi:hypothetical protein
MTKVQWKRKKKKKVDSINKNQKLSVLKISTETLVLKKHEIGIRAGLYRIGGGLQSASYIPWWFKETLHTSVRVPNL